MAPGIDPGSGAAGEFLLTGKLWRSVYHVRLIEGPPGRHIWRLLAG